MHSEIPRTLTICPRCRGGELVWDGRNAWRCNDPEGKCRHAAAAAAVFEADSLLEELRMGRQLRSIPLTDYGAVLLANGVLRLSWTPPGAELFLDDLSA